MAILPYSLTVSVNPTIEPVSVEQAKRQSDEDDNARDRDFAEWIEEGREQVEHDARRALINKTIVLKMDSFPADDYLELPNPPLSSVTSVQYVDTAGSTQTFSSGSYTVDTNRTPGVILLNYGASWPTVRGQKNAVTVTYVAGYGSTAASVPAWAKAAIMLFVRQRFDEPESAELPVGFSALCQRGSWGDYP